MEAFGARKALLTEELIGSAGLDPHADRHKAGYIAAINDMQNIEIEEVELNGN